MTVLMASGNTRMAPMGPPVATDSPRKGRSLYQDDDYPDAGHEPGYNRVRGIGNEAPYSQNAQKNLYDPRHDDYGERFGEAVRIRP